MKEYSKWAYGVFMVWAALVFILSGKIAFGNGLGDVFIYLLLAVCIVVVFLVKRHLSKPENLGKDFLLLILVGFIMIGFTLKMTVGRGPEYPWNGKLFLHMDDAVVDTSNHTLIIEKQDSTKYLINPLDSGLHAPKGNSKTDGSNK